ncbi:MAG: histidine kinase dimerization/phospho-acceptor domain-containing protein [Cyanobacteria bacterium P01_H01_bin.15]
MDEPTASELEETRLGLYLATELAAYKGGFLARTAHELRSPMSRLLSLHQLILNDLCTSPQEEREFIQEAYNAAKKFLGLLDEAIAISKINYGTGRLSKQTIYLSNVCDCVYQRLRLLLENRSYQLTIMVDDGLFIVSDPNRLEQTLLLLIETAITQLVGLNLTLFGQQTENGVMLKLQGEFQPDFWQEIEEPSIQMAALETLEDAYSLSRQMTFSPGMKFWLLQTLVESLKGRLRVQSVSENPALSCLCIQLPLTLEP